MRFLESFEKTPRCSAYGRYAPVHMGLLHTELRVAVQFVHPNASTADRSAGPQFTARLNEWPCFANGDICNEMFYLNLESDNPAATAST